MHLRKLFLGVLIAAAALTGLASRTSANVSRDFSVTATGDLPTITLANGENFCVITTRTPGVGAAISVVGSSDGGRTFNPITTFGSNGNVTPTTNTQFGGSTSNVTGGSALSVFKATVTALTSGTLAGTIGCYATAFPNGSSMVWLNAPSPAPTTSTGALKMGGEGTNGAVNITAPNAQATGILVPLQIANSVVQVPLTDGKSTIVWTVTGLTGNNNTLNFESTGNAWTTAVAQRCVNSSYQFVTTTAVDGVFICNVSGRTDTRLRTTSVGSTVNATIDYNTTVANGPNFPFSTLGLGALQAMPSCGGCSTSSQIAIGSPPASSVGVRIYCPPNASAVYTIESVTSGTAIGPITLSNPNTATNVIWIDEPLSAGQNIFLAAPPNGCFFRFM